MRILTINDRHRERSSRQNAVVSLGSKIRVHYRPGGGGAKIVTHWLEFLGSEVKADQSYFGDKQEVKPDSLVFIPVT